MTTKTTKAVKKSNVQSATAKAVKAIKAKSDAKSVSNSDFTTFLVKANDFVSAEQDKAKSAESAFSQTSDTDHKRAMQNSSTKAKYVSHLMTASESALTKAVDLFDKAAIEECFNNSYSCKKIKQLFEAIEKNDISIIKDKALISFLAQFALSGKTDSKRKYASAIGHKTLTQLNQIMKAFERLNIARRDGENIVKTDHKAVAMIEALND